MPFTDEFLDPPEACVLARDELADRRELRLRRQRIAAVGSGDADPPRAARNRALETYDGSDDGPQPA